VRFGGLKRNYTFLRADIRKSFNVNAFPTLKLCVLRPLVPGELSSWMPSSRAHRLNEGKATTYDGQHTVHPLPLTFAIACACRRCTARSELWRAGAQVKDMVAFARRHATMKVKGPWALPIDLPSSL
jgi:hypothetical protein